MIALYGAINQEPFGIPTVRIHRTAPSQRGDSKRFFYLGGYHERDRTNVFQSNEKNYF